MTVKIEVEVFWAVKPCSVAVGYHHHLCNVSILSQHYAASQPGRPRHDPLKFLYQYLCSLNYVSWQVHLGAHVRVKGLYHV